MKFFLRTALHPERASEPILGSDDGKWIFESIFAALESSSAAKLV